MGRITHLCSRHLTEAEFSTTASELHFHWNDNFLDELAMLNKCAGAINQHLQKIINDQK